jgi:hypothetical protein
MPARRRASVVSQFGDQVEVAPTGGATVSERIFQGTERGTGRGQQRVSLVRHAGTRTEVRISAFWRGLWPTTFGLPRRPGSGTAFGAGFTVAGAVGYHLAFDDLRIAS